MFKEITLINYRTHKYTTIQLKPVTLFIGNNNSGKSNFLAGVQHFSRLIRRGNPTNSKPAKIGPQDYYPHRYRFAKDDEGTGISLSWITPEGSINYRIDLYLDQSSVRCKEKITVTSNENEKMLTSGYDTPTDRIDLRSLIEQTASLTEVETRLCRKFFRDFASVFTYHLQPSFLKGRLNENSDESRMIENNFDKGIAIPSYLGYEGRNLQQVLFYAKQKEERVFSRFVALIRRFNNTFHSIRLDQKSRPIWEFDFGRKTTERPIEEFPPNVLSDGFIKAAAIALLVSVQRPPSLILLEELENGINPGNIQEIMTWIWQATTPNQENNTSQFIITSHSPSVLREFHEYLNHVYTFHLVKRNSQSDVRNLNTSLETLVGIGALDGEIIEDDEGKPIINIPKYQLAELWYSGTIG